MVLGMGEGTGSYLSLVAHRLYEVALALGGPGLFVVALLDSSFLSVPEGNDFLIIVLSTGQSWERMAYLASMTVLGSVAGCAILYSVGRRGGQFMETPPRRKRLHEVRKTYQRWGLWAVLVPSILPPPTPFKVFVLSAGVFRLPFWKFFTAVLVGRSVRYFFWGVLAVLYGEWAKEVLESSLGTFAAGLLVILVMVASAFYIVRKVKGRRKMAERGKA